MSNLFKSAFCIFLSLFLLASFSDCDAQHKKIKDRRPVKDSLRRALLKRDSLLRTFRHSDNSLNALLQKIEYYNSSYTQDFSDLTQGFDTLEISQKLPAMEKRMPLVNNLIQNDRSSTLGYLFTIRDALSHSKNDIDS